MNWKRMYDWQISALDSWVANGAVLADLAFVEGEMAS